ncbi:unnamed protein product [Brassica oleracea var. botrytis]|uniref:(rape) hypothetical protein n=1 Tax=Brassica napus TaxID=3708 RepID=A0A078FU01_BRANA|nr:unnamed protein product [Brassica napus]CDY16312.1 BnaC01g23470D [Brassica napus]
MFSSPSSSCLRLRRKSGNGQLIIYTLSLSLSRVWTALQDCILDILFSLERVNHGRLLPCYSNQGPSFLASLILILSFRSSKFEDLLCF